MVSWPQRHQRCALSISKGQATVMPPITILDVHMSKKEFLGDICVYTYIYITVKILGWF